MRSTQIAEAKQLTLGDIKALLNWDATPKISCYFPLHPTGREFQQDPIHLKNQLVRASEELERRGWREPDIRGLLEPAWALQADEDFWPELGARGLALFVAPGLFQYHLLPRACVDFLLVGNQFHVKPLVRLLHGDGRYYLLALSQNRVQTFVGTRAGLAPIALPEDMPSDLASAVAGTEIQRSLQHHASSGPSDAGSPEGQIHGHGRPTDEREDLLEEFLRQVAKATERWLQDRRMPLVLAGVDHVVSTVRKACRAPQLLESGIQGNPESMSQDELHEKSWPIAEAWFLQDLDKARDRYGDLIGAGKTSSDLEEILDAAHHARVDTIFAAAENEVWGTYDPEAKALTTHPKQESGDAELIGQAVNETLVNGGWAYVVKIEDLPEGTHESGVAATLRW